MADDLTFDFERTFTDVGAPGGFQVGRCRCWEDRKWPEDEGGSLQGRTALWQLSLLPAAASAAACRRSRCRCLPALMFCRPKLPFAFHLTSYWYRSVILLLAGR